MRNLQEARLGWPKIPWVLEIRLCNDTWAKIVQIAELQKLTYSHVVRYAIFRLIKRRSLRRHLGMDGGSVKAYNKYEILRQKTLARRANFRGKHRHRLCLYGEDEIAIRVAAAQLRCSMTHLVRLALEYRLQEMLVSSMSINQGGFAELSWYWLGIKLYAGIKFPRFGTDVHLFYHICFQAGDYW